MAIAHDSAVSGTGGTTSPRDHSHTCSGSDRILFVATFSQGTVSGVTYNGVSMTSLGTYTYPAPATEGQLWYLINPAAGSNTVSISHSGSFTIGISSSYTGARQTGVPDATIQTNTGTTNTLTTNITTVADNCWLITGGIWEGSGSMSAGANTFLRQDGSNTAIAFFDSNGAQTPAGSKSQTVNTGSSAPLAIGTVSFAPSGSASPSSTLLLMGVG